MARQKAQRHRKEILKTTPNSILEGFVKNIDGIYGHYKVVNDHLQPMEKDQDVELMSIYREKMEQLEQ